MGVWRVRGNGMTELTELERGRAPARLASLVGRWRDSIAAGLRDRSATVQVAVGAAGLPMADSVGLMQYSDIIVPREPAVSVAEGLGRRWSDAYLDLLNALLPATETGLRGLLASRYPGWIACRNADPRSGAHLALFHVWAGNNLPPAQADRAIALYREQMADPLMQAMDRFSDGANRLYRIGRRGQVERLPLYSAEIDCARSQLANAPGLSFDCDSDALAGPVGDADSLPASCRARYFWSRSPRPSAEMRRLDARALSGRITISGRIGRLALVQTRPLGWCDGFEIERAFLAGPDPSVWDDAACHDGWSRFFGPDGLLARRIGAILVASDIDLTVTSHVRYEPHEVAAIRAEATGGVWPLIAGETAPTHKVRVVHNPDGTISHRLQLPPDRVQILGGVPIEAPF